MFRAFIIIHTFTMIGYVHLKQVVVPYAEHVWCKSGQTFHWEIYQAKKHLVTQAVLTAKSNFYTSRIMDCVSCKMLFSVTNVMLGKTNTSPLSTNVPPHQLANVFRHFFATKIEIIQNKLDGIQSRQIPTAAPHVETPLVDFKPVSEEKILEILKTCQTKSCDLDPMPTSLLLECTDSLLPSLTYLINHFLQSATFPSEFKTLVKPLLKKHNLNPNQLKNYRPVLNLPFLSKLLEKIVLSQLTEHLNKNKLGYIFQSAYRHGDSTSLCAQ